MASLKNEVANLEDRLCVIAEKNTSASTEDKPVPNVNNDVKFTVGSLWFISSNESKKETT